MKKTIEHMPLLIEKPHRVEVERKKMVAVTRVEKHYGNPKYYYEDTKIHESCLVDKSRPRVLVELRTQSPPREKVIERFDIDWERESRMRFEKVNPKSPSPMKSQYDHGYKSHPLPLVDYRSSNINRIHHDLRDDQLLKPRKVPTRSER